MYRCTLRFFRCESLISNLEVGRLKLFLPKDGKFPLYPFVCSSYLDAFAYVHKEILLSLFIRKRLYKY